jgi:1-acyl-sn-glycerol-3-phosphate acyltransferase|tara:strand:+ start:3919 stop:4704 length:786 start_codon:yes stop_codon:yes gene_type:complete
MDTKESLASAWSSLENHWLIPTTGTALPKVPGYGLLRWTLSPLLRPLVNIKIIGANHIPRKGPVILAANHLSHVDPIMVIASARRPVRYLAKDGHFSNKALGAVMRITGQIETKRDEGGSQALSSAADVLASKGTLGIFPEGTRSKRTEPPFLLPGKTGVARIAASYPDTVVVPMALIGTRKMMEANKDKFPKLWKRVTMNVGKGVTWLEWLGHEQGGAMNAEHLTELLTLEDHEVRTALAGLYRKFTDQLMASMKALGAP